MTGGSRGPTEEAWKGRRVPEVTRPGLEVLFVGINPGRYSAAAGRHFAGPGNQFWRLLYDSGLTPLLLRPEDDGRLPDFGLGVTNIVSRPSPGSGDLKKGELARGGRRLRTRVGDLRPKIVCLLGKEVYRHYVGLGPSARLDWGVQEREVVPGVTEFLAPNPSSRSTIPYAERLALFRRMVLLLGRRPPGERGLIGGK